MAAYQLTSSGVLRTADNANIPNDPANRDWLAYQAWLGLGNTPDPLVVSTKPPLPPSPREWLERLDAPTQAAITNAAMNSASLLLWILKAAGSPSIDVTNADTITGVQALVTAGVLTTAQQTTLLTP